MNEVSNEEKVYNHIKEKLLLKEIFPGMQLIEDELVQETGVSRTPVRAAIKKLCYEGLVEIIPYKGAFIAKPTYYEISDAYQCKKILEEEAVKLACHYITTEEIERLEELLELSYEIHNRRSAREFYGINQEFHRIIAKASRNIFLQKYIGELMNKCDVYLIFYDDLIYPALESPAYNDHKSILEALKERNENAAVAAMRRHSLVTLNELEIPGEKENKKKMVDRY